MTDFAANVLMAAAFIVTLGYAAFIHESTCPSCPVAIGARPGVAMIPIPELRPINE